MDTEQSRHNHYYLGKETTMRRGPYGIIGLIVLIILVVLVLRLLGVI